MSKAADIKNQIKAALQDLKNDGTLGEFIVDDFKKGLYQRDYAAFPSAVLTTASISNDYYTNSENIRAYTFEIVIISKGEDVSTSETSIEDLSEAIINKFDHLFSLSGVADAGLDPSTTPAEPVPTASGTFIVFSVILKAKAVKDVGL